MDLRTRIVAACDAGDSPADVAQTFSVTTRTVYKLLAVRRERGSLQPRSGQRGPKPKLQEHRDAILQAIRKTPGTTLEELRTQLKLPGCLATLWVALRRWGSRSKKVVRAAEQLRPDVQTRRRWWDILVRGRIAPDRLVFLDETAVTTGALRLYGWGQTSERVVDHQPLGNWKTWTFVSALRADGLTAPFLLEGPLTGDAFWTYVKRVLLPTLRRGDRVVLDNVAPQHDDRIEELLRRRHAKLLFLPPYSPDLNPIENAYSKLKTSLRRVAARTFEGLCEALKTILKGFPAEECRRYLGHCGY